MQGRNEREIVVVVVVVLLLLLLLELFKSLILQAEEQGQLADHEHNSDRKNVSREEKWERQERHVKDVKKMERAREGDSSRVEIGGGGRGEEETRERERERKRKERGAKDS
jgi:hypothetical protein